MARSSPDQPARAAPTAARRVASATPFTVMTPRRRVTDGITAEEYRATLAVLQRMAVNLGWADDPGR